MAKQNETPRLWGAIRYRCAAAVSDARLLATSTTGRFWMAGAGVITAVMIVGSLTMAALDVDSPGMGLALPSVDEAPVARLPMEVNERVQYWLERFTTDQRVTFATYLAHEGVFGDLIREKLRSRGMPEELLYLAMIESGFQVRATSQVSAAGVWQFMGPTAQAYGLRIDEWVDERRDPIEATEAALDYIQFLHDRYGSWYLAAAAYNAGPSRVDRALRRGGDAGNGEAGEEDIFWDIQHHLPRETREYIPRMIAAAMLAREAEAYGFGEVVRESAYAFDRVWVPGGTTLSRVAAAVGTDQRVLRTLNPHLIRSTVPPGSSYALRVPVGSARQVVAAIGGGPWGTRATDD